MSFKNSLILFVIFMALGILGYVGSRNGYYPLALVNFEVVNARDTENNFSAAYRYFKNAAAVYGLDIKKLESEGSRLELKRSVLEKLIQDKLIYQELKRRLRKSDFQAAAENKINNFLANAKNLKEASENLYGLELEEFKQRVLAPQAYQEILEGRMNLNNENFSEWLIKRRSEAAIIILSPNFEWRDGRVQLKK